MTTIRSATSIASSWSWVTNTVVVCVSSCSRRSQTRSSARTRASSAPNGSSRRSTSGSRRERPGERHALPLAARELGRVAVAEALQLHEVDQLVDAGLRLGRRALADLQPERDVVAHRHVLEGRVVLEDEADASLLGRRVGGVLAREEDLARVGLLEAGDDPQQRRLARAARAEERGEGASVDIDRHVVERMEVPEVLRHVPHLNRHQLTPSFGLSLVMMTRTTTASAASTSEMPYDPARLRFSYSSWTRRVAVSVLP